MRGTFCCRGGPVKSMAISSLKEKSMKPFLKAVSRSSVAYVGYQQDTASTWMNLTAAFPVCYRRRGHWQLNRLCWGVEVFVVGWGSAECLSFWSNRSTYCSIGFLLAFDRFLEDGFFPAVFGPLSSTMSIIVTLFLLPLNHAKNSFNTPFTCATAKTCSHIFEEKLAKERSQDIEPSFPGRTL